MGEAQKYWEGRAKFEYEPISMQESGMTNWNNLFFPPDSSKFKSLSCRDPIYSIDLYPDT